MKRMTVMMDIDDVLADEARQIQKWIHSAYGVGPGDVPYEGTDYRVYKNIKGVSKKDVEKLRENPDFYRTMPPFEGISNFTRQISIWADIHIVTARHEYPSIGQDTINWLQRNGVEYLTLSLIPAKKKKDYCGMHGINLAFEDNPKTIDSIAKIIPIVGIRWPYNENKDDKVMFADNYYEAVEISQGILGFENMPWKYPQSTKKISSQ